MIPRFSLKHFLQIYGEVKIDGKKMDFLKLSDGYMGRGYALFFFSFSICLKISLIPGKLKTYIWKAKLLKT